MLLLILGLLDIVVGILLWFFRGSAGSNLIIILGILYILKGLWSIIAAAAEGFYFDVLGWVDILAGIFLSLIFFSLSFDFLFYLGIIMIIKGVYSMLMGMR